MISLIEWGASGLVKASALYRSAEDLNRFQRKVAQLLAGSADGQALGTEEATLLRTEYEDLKMQCHFNHEPVDYQLFLANYRLSPEFLDQAGRPRMSWVRAHWTKIFGYMNVGWYFGVFWIVIALLLSRTLWIAA